MISLWAHCAAFRVLGNELKNEPLGVKWGLFDMRIWRSCQRESSAELLVPWTSSVFLPEDGRVQVQQYLVKAKGMFWHSPCSAGAADHSFLPEAVQSALQLLHVVCSDHPRLRVPQRLCQCDLCCHLWSLLAALFHRGHRAVQPRLWPLQHLPGFSLGIPRMCWEERSCHVDLEARYASGTGCLAPSSLVLAFRSSKLALAGSPSTLQGTFQWFSSQWAGDGCCGKGKITSLLSCFILIENLRSNLLSRRLFS